MSSYARRIVRSVPVSSGVATTITHGQDINNLNTGRTGAATASAPNYSSTMTTVSGTKTFSTSQTIRNTRFTGQVNITGGNVIFEYCLFAFVPTSSADTGSGYYQVLINGGTATFNWCDLDTGYRSTGNQGIYACTDNFSANERTHDPITDSHFVMYRCHFQGCNQAIAAHNYYSAAPGSFATECLMDNLVGPDRTSPNGHPDNIELSSSTGVTIERCRIDCSPEATAHINRTLDWGDDNHAPTTIKDNYFAGEASSPILVQANSVPGAVASVYITGNRFTAATYGSSSNGHILLASNQNVTYNITTAQNATKQPVVYWGHAGSDANVWAPDGMDVVQGQAAGSLVGAEDFFRNGSPDTWNGTLLP